jgi:hypothetical protein
MKLLIAFVIILLSTTAFRVSAQQPLETFCVIIDVIPEDPNVIMEQATVRFACEASDPLTRRFDESYVPRSEFEKVFKGIEVRDGTVFKMENNRPRPTHEKLPREVARLRAFALIDKAVANHKRTK